MSCFLRDFILTVLLFVAAIFAGTSYYQTNWPAVRNRNVYAEEWFDPAVAIACANRITDHLDAASHRLVARFAAFEITHIDCDQIKFTDTTNQINSFVFQHFYLVSSTGLLWKLTGITWSGFAAMAALFYAIAIASSYLFFRLFLNRVLSVFLAICFATSANFVYPLPSIRDFSRSAFVPFAIATVFLLILRPTTWRPKLRLAVACAMGTALGFGYRFRSDHLLVFLIVLFLYCFSMAVARRLLSKACLRELGLLLVSFFVLVAGIPYPWSHYTPHIWDDLLSQNLLHGQMNNQTLDLGLEQPSYELGYMAEDAGVVELVHSYAQRAQGSNESQVERLPKGVTSEIFWKRLFVNFPADFAVRAFAAIRIIIVLPFLSGRYFGNPDFGAAFLNDVSKMRNQITEAGYLFRYPIVLLGLLVLCLRNSSAFLLLASGILLFGAYPSLRFQLRHFSYLEPFGLLAAGGFLSIVGTFTDLLRQRKFNFLKCQSEGPGVRSYAKRLSLVLILVGVVWASSQIGLFILRLYQGHQISKIVNAYTEARTASARTIISQKNGRTLWRVPASSPPAPLGNRFISKLYKITFANQLCPQMTLDLRALIKWSSGPITEQHFEIRLEKNIGESSFFYPAFFWELRTFQGFGADTSEAACVKSVEEVEGPVPIPLMILNLPANWEEKTRFYQRLKSIRDLKTYLF